MRTRRQAAGVSLEALAALIGVRASTLSRWERGRAPHAVYARAWEEALAAAEAAFPETPQ